MSSTTAIGAPRPTLRNGFAIDPPAFRPPNYDDLRTLLDFEHIIHAFHTYATDCGNGEAMALTQPMADFLDQIIHRMQHDPYYTLGSEAMGGYMMVVEWFRQEAEGRALLEWFRQECYRHVEDIERAAARQLIAEGFYSPDEESDDGETDVEEMDDAATDYEEMDDAATDYEETDLESDWDEDEGSEEDDDDDDVEMDEDLDESDEEEVYYSCNEY